MKFASAIALLIKEWLAGPIRYLRAVKNYPHVSFRPGVAIGSECRFGRHVHVSGDVIMAHVLVGDYSYIGSGSRLENCQLGRFCSLGRNVQIGLGIHPTNLISTYPGFYAARESSWKCFASNSEVIETQQVTIGNDVWIGNNTMIADGVDIGHGAVIGAGAVVTSSVPPYAIVGGVPAKIIRMRFPEDKISFLLDFRWWDRDDAFFFQQGSLFSQPDVFFNNFDN